VDLSDDLPSPRRSLFFPVVIATVFLTIIGMSAGLALASWHKSQTSDNNGQSSISTPTPAPTSADAGKPACRPETQAIAPRFGAQGTLRIELLLRTKSSAVWICEDEAGNFFYHANRGGEHATWIEGQTALFLAGVEPDGDGGYLVKANDGTSFSINSTRLLIVHKDGSQEVQTAA
jgi:hypothetical protein